MQVVCPLWSVSGFHLESSKAAKQMCRCGKAKQRTKQSKGAKGQKKHSESIRTWHCHGNGHRTVPCVSCKVPHRNSPIHQFSHHRTVPLRRDALDVFLLHSMPPRQDVLHLQKKCCFKWKLTTRHNKVSFLKQSKVAVSQNHSILLPIQEEMEKSSSLNGCFMPIRRKHAAMP